MIRVSREVWTPSKTGEAGKPRGWRGQRPPEPAASVSHHATGRPVSPESLFLLSHNRKCAAVLVSADANLTLGEGVCECGRGQSTVAAA